MHQLVLASQSPRRLELLQKAGFALTVDSVKVSEIIDKNLNLPEALQKLAKNKVEALLKVRNYMIGQDFLILGADTIVVIDQRILGKPKNSNQAREFLGLLSGRTHKVMTALCFFDCKKQIYKTDFETTKILMKQLTSQEIETYVQSGEPEDKAGAYAIQGQGRIFVMDRQGSWSNVVGLPMELFERMLLENEWHVSRNADKGNLKEER
ncbi:MAG: Maf family protein [Bdellovibrionales bacterium]|nr:Maf family protein [Bdellovibrionales bacterium]